MTPSLILRTSAPLLLWVPVVVSVYIVLRGHNEPGGGFLGGLMASAGLLFFALARGREAALDVLRLRPVAVCGLGVLVALASGLPAFLDPDAGYLTHRWWFPDLGFKLPLGTALIFDIGVYLTVVGTVTAIFFALIAEET